MKATQFKEYGDPDVLQLVETGEPHAGPGEIRIAVRAAGVNPTDWKFRAGYLREKVPLSLPAGSGLDAAGIVDELGDGADGAALGDAVFGTGTSTYAEYAVLTSWVRKPDGLSFAEAAGYPVPVATAQHISDLAGVKAGQTILISGRPPLRRRPAAYPCRQDVHPQPGAGRPQGEPGRPRRRTHRHRHRLTTRGRPAAGALDRLALGTLAALQGGLLFTQAKRDVGPLEAALDLAISQIRYHPS